VQLQQVAAKRVLEQQKMEQGCQIILGAKKQNWVKRTKTAGSIPDCHEI
jgi:hypothetical protein